MSQRSGDPDSSGNHPPPSDRTCAAFHRPELAEGPPSPEFCRSLSRHIGSAPGNPICHHDSFAAPPLLRNEPNSSTPSAPPPHIYAKRTQFPSPPIIQSTIYNLQSPHGEPNSSTPSVPPPHIFAKRTQFPSKPPFYILQYTIYNIQSRGPISSPPPQPPDRTPIYAKRTQLPPHDPTIHDSLLTIHSFTKTNPISAPPSVVIPAQAGIQKSQPACFCETNPIYTPRCLFYFRLSTFASLAGISPRRPKISPDLSGIFQLPAYRNPTKTASRYTSELQYYTSTLYIFRGNGSS